MGMENARTNPNRPPDWVWQRAQEIRERRGPRASRNRDTTTGFKWIRHMVGFMNELDAAVDDNAIQLLSEREADTFWAHWIYTRPETESHRYMIESHILAREDDFAIGYRCGMPPGVIATYENVFFNVREKLHHRGYVINTVLGAAIHRGLQDRDYDLLWKLYGYFLGPHVVDALQSKFASPAWCGTVDGVGSALMDDAISTLKLKAAVAAKTVPVNQQTQIALMEQFTKFVEVERTTDSAGKAQEQILDHIHAMMAALPFNVGGRDPREGDALIDRGPMTRFEQSAVELTYEETMRVSVRQPIANEETLLKLAFPEPKAVIDAPKIEDKS